MLNREDMRNKLVEAIRTQSFFLLLRLGLCIQQNEEASLHGHGCGVYSEQKDQK